MISSNSCSFLSNTGVGGSCSNFSDAQRRCYGPRRMVCIAQSSRSNDASVAVETKLNGIKDDSVVVDVNGKPTVGGGVQDAYGEDRATEDQFVTPWSLSVARSHI